MRNLLLLALAAPLLAADPKPAPTPPATLLAQPLAPLVVDSLTAGGEMGRWLSSKGKWERRPDGLSAGDDERFRFGRDIADDARHAGLDDARLLARDGGVGGPEVFLVVEPDRGDHADLRGADIGGVEPTA